MTQEPTQRRAKHLIDPAAPRKVSTAAERERLAHVQRVVMSVLVGTTIFHLSVGLVIGATFVDEAATVARVGLCVLGGLFGVVAVSAVLAIHRRSLYSPWIALGLLPGVVGLFLVL